MDTASPVRYACWKAERLIIAAAQAGATAAIQPGGSVKDTEVIQAANENEVAMVFTGTRHFRH